MRDPLRGEIWWVELNPTVGAEINKRRPCVVVQRNNFGKLPIRIVVPITDWKPQYRSYIWMIHLVPDAANQLSKESAADALAVRSVSVERMQTYAGSLPKAVVDEISVAVARCMGLDSLSAPAITLR